MNVKRHFIIVEIETTEAQSSKVAEDMVLDYIRKAKLHRQEFVFKSVGWIADKVRPAPTGVQFP